MGTKSRREHMEGRSRELLIPSTGAGFGQKLKADHHGMVAITTVLSFN